MKITKCDICKKTMASGTESLHLAYSNIGIFESFEICSVCGKSITKFLKDKKLIKTENKKNGK